jgi:sulfur carrier protein
MIGILDAMTVIVNGQPKTLAPNATVRALIEQSNLSPDKVAIELNRRLLKTERYDTPLKENDEVEIVTFVGGG